MKRERNKEIYRLVNEEKLSFKEIAKRMDLSSSAVSSAYMHERKYHAFSEKIFYKICKDTKIEFDDVLLFRAFMCIYHCVLLTDKNIGYPGVYTIKETMAYKSNIVIGFLMRLYKKSILHNLDIGSEKFFKQKIRLIYGIGPNMSDMITNIWFTSQKLHGV